MPKSNVACFLFITILFSVTGCASFKGEMVPEVQTFPAIPDPKPSAQVKIHWRAFLNGNEIRDPSRNAEINAANLAKGIFNESNLFSRVGDRINNPDLLITIRMQDQGSGNMAMAFLTGLTLYLWPSSATDLYVLDADVVNRNTGKTYTYHLEDKVVFRQQLFLIFLTPFNPPSTVPNEVIENLYANLLVEMEKDRALNLQATGPSSGESSMQISRLPNP